MPRRAGSAQYTQHNSPAQMHEHLSNTGDAKHYPNPSLASQPAHYHSLHVGSLTGQPNASLNSPEFASVPWMRAAGGLCGSP